MLGQEESTTSALYLHAQKVMEFSQIFHREFTLKSCNDALAQIR